MDTHRKCQRCQGDEFLLTTASGEVVTWRHRDGEYRTWFCPHCDWQKPRSDRR